MVVFDADRTGTDEDAGRGPGGIGDSGNMLLVRLAPNLEGVLVRLHSGHETRHLQPNEARRRLRQLWPEYEKPASALLRRFDLEDLRRAARHDCHMRALLALLGLQTPRSGRETHRGRPGSGREGGRG